MSRILPHVVVQLPLLFARKHVMLHKQSMPAGFLNHTVDRGFLG